jgi:membrane protein implicated in regulation of membrane protease activity
MTHQGKESTMSTNSAIRPSTDPLETASALLVGGGILTMALFPLALPMIALLAIAAIPLLLIGLLAALAAAVLAAPVIAVRRLRRRLTREQLPRTGKVSEPGPAVGAAATAGDPVVGGF